MTTSEHNHSDSGESDSVCSSLGYASGIDHDLPSWLSGREVWTIAIAHWNDTPPGSIFLVYKFGRGQDDITMGNVLRKMIDKLGDTFNKRKLYLFFPQRTATLSDWMTRAATTRSGYFSTSAPALMISAGITRLNYTTT